MSNVWNVARCKVGHERHCVAMMAQFYPEATPEIITYCNWMKKRRGGVYCDERVLLPGLVFFKLPPNLNCVEFEICTGAKIARVDDDWMMTVDDEELGPLRLNAAAGTYSNGLSKALLYFGQFIGKTYTIKTGMFTGIAAKVIGLEPPHVHFEFELGGCVQQHFAPAKMLFSFEKGNDHVADHIKAFEFSCGLRVEHDAEAEAA